MSTLLIREPARRRAPSEPSCPANDPAVALRFLKLLATPAAGCVELRVLRGAFDRRGDVHRADRLGSGFVGSTLAGWYDDPDRLAAQCRRLRGVSAYVTINPARTDLMARSDSRLSPVRHTTRDEDVACLRWLFLDIDPKRPADVSSTDAELAAAVERRDAVLAGQPELAAAAIWGRSGNGAWALVRLPDYPNDAEHRGLVAETVRALSREYSDDAVVIDTATVNPSRLIGLPGTLKAKGSPRPDRPWRLATLDGVADAFRA
jgi:hypothetical protein